MTGAYLLPCGSQRLLGCFCHCLGSAVHTRDAIQGEEVGQGCGKRERTKRIGLWLLPFGAHTIGAATDIIDTDYGT